MAAAHLDDTTSRRKELTARDEVDRPRSVGPSGRSFGGRNAKVEPSGRTASGRLPALSANVRRSPSVGVGVVGLAGHWQIAMPLMAWSDSPWAIAVSGNQSHARSAVSAHTHQVLDWLLA